MTQQITGEAGHQLGGALPLAAKQIQLTTAVAISGNGQLLGVVAHPRQQLL